MKLTRRQWAALAAAAPVPDLPASAAPQRADAELEAARQRLRANAGTLATAQVPMSVEPAFQFKA